MRSALRMAWLMLRCTNSTRMRHRDLPSLVDPRHRPVAHRKRRAAVRGCDPSARGCSNPVHRVRDLASRVRHLPPAPGTSARADRRTAARECWLRVYLTNSLTGWTDDGLPTGHTLFPELEAELRDAAVAKHHDPILAVIGYPPYEGYSMADNDEERALLADWITPLWPMWGIRETRGRTISTCDSGAWRSTGSSS